MARLRALCALLVSASILVMPVWGAPSTALGTVTTASGAWVGESNASTGATVFAGDKLSTNQHGTLQVRAGAARFMLSASSAALFAPESASPSATLQRGTAVFSTANAKAFVLNAEGAEIRPNTDRPTVAQVSVVNSKELIVRSTKGELAITFDGETQIVPEATSYRVILDPAPYLASHPEADPAAAQGPRGVGSRGGGPLKAGRSRFLLLAIIVTSVATGFAIYHAVQSPDRP